MMARAKEGGLERGRLRLKSTNNEKVGVELAKYKTKGETGVGDEII